jgi:membrane protein
MSGFGKRYSAFDRFQQRHRWLGFPLAVLLKYAGLALSTALNVGLFWLGFRVLTPREVSWRLRGGAIAAGVLYELLQTVGGYYVGHTLKNASNVYGTFGLVIGLWHGFEIVRNL